MFPTFSMPPSFRNSFRSELQGLILFLMEAGPEGVSETDQISRARTSETSSHLPPRRLA